jgi:hypothetical protein
MSESAMMLRQPFLQEKSAQETLKTGAGAYLQLGECTRPGHCRQIHVRVDDLLGKLCFRG